MILPLSFLFFSKKSGKMFVDSKISRIFASLLRNKAFNDFSGCSAVRLAHLLWEQGVPGSNPGIPTRKELQKCNSYFYLATDYTGKFDEYTH